MDWAHQLGPQACVGHRVDGDGAAVLAVRRLVAAAPQVKKAALRLEEVVKGSKAEIHDSNNIMYCVHIVLFFCRLQRRPHAKLKITKIKQRSGRQLSRTRKLPVIDIIIHVAKSTFSGVPS